MAILSTHNLTVGYRKGKARTPVISSLNLELKKGKLTALVGANGIGKSTLLRTITGNQAPLTGIVKLDGKDINDIEKQELSLLLGIVNTDRTQAGGLTVRELASLGRQPHTGFLGILRRQDKAIVDKAMSEAGISHKAECFVAELSDGERQKVMIAKALAQETPIIILDEPTAFLDVASRIETMLLLHRLAHEQDKAVLLSSHDVSQSMMLADELWLVSHDRTLISGNTEDIALSGAMDNIFSSPHVKFDLAQGDFNINIEPTRYVTLNCQDKIVRSWITNALKRNKYGISTGNDSKITINAASATELNITDGTHEISATSISELLESLGQFL